MQIFSSANILTICSGRHSLFFWKLGDNKWEILGFYWCTLFFPLGWREENRASRQWIIPESFIFFSFFCRFSFYHISHCLMAWGFLLQFSLNIPLFQMIFFIFLLYWKRDHLWFWLVYMCMCLFTISTEKFKWSFPCISTLK